MNWKGLKAVIIMGALAAFVMAPGVSFGALFTAPNNYSGGITISDVDGTNGTETEINAISWTQDASYYYFKMDLLGNKYSSSGSSNVTYSILINLDPTGSTGGTYRGLSGVDYYIQVAANTTLDTSSKGYLNYWNTAPSSDRFSSATGTSLPAVDYQYSSGNLEWRIAKTGFIPLDFWFAGATDKSWSNNDDDVTSLAKTPIPGAAWLLGSGLIGLVALKRRKTTKA